jgi:O-antigen ligase
MPFFLALSLFLTSGTAVELLGLRLSDLAAIAVVLFLILTGSVSLRDRFGLMAILILLVVSVYISSAIQLNVNPENFESGLRNTVAISLGLFIAFLLQRHSSMYAILLVKHYSRICLGVCLGLYVFQYLFYTPSWIGEVEVAERFSAISVNPNQLALFLLPLPFFAILCYVAGVISRREMVGVMLLAIVINLVVIGKALFVAWFFSFGFLYLVGWNLPGKSVSRRGSVLTRVMFCLIIAIVTSPVFFKLYSGDIAGGQDEQGETRVALWYHGLQAWGDAMLWGHGSGHYSGLDSPYEGMEAHNFFIDWLGAYGVVGAVLLMAFFIIIFILTWKSSKLLFAFMLAISIQMMFHFYARQPIFWVWWVVAFILAKDFLVLKKQTSR